MKRSAPGASRRLLVCVVCLGLLGMAGGCGSGRNRTRNHSHNTSTIGNHPSGLAGWEAKTQELCREKQAAIAGLGSVHITYGGIARLGIPAVKRLLTRYLDRLLAVLHQFAARQGQLSTPPSRVAITNRVRSLDGEVQAATVHLRMELAGVTSATGLSAAFRTWLAALQRLGARGEALAQQLKLPACESARPAAQNASS
jgi:hypothetical protein